MTPETWEERVGKVFSSAQTITPEQWEAQMNARKGAATTGLEQVAPELPKPSSGAIIARMNRMLCNTHTREQRQALVARAKNVMHGCDGQDGH